MSSTPTAPAASVGDADGSGEHAQDRRRVGHRSNTVDVGVPPKWSTATAAASSGSKGRQENTSTKPQRLEPPGDVGAVGGAEPGAGEQQWEAVSGVDVAPGAGERAEDDTLPLLHGLQSGRKSSVRRS